MTDDISKVRESFPGAQAADLVKRLVETQVREQESRWSRIEDAVSFLKRRGETNHFSEGIRDLVEHAR